MVGFDDIVCAERKRIERTFYAQFPVFFDVLYPEESQITGIGYIDLCKEPQLYIDKLNQIILENALISGKPRFFYNSNGGINIDDYTDLSKTVIPVAGSVNDENIKQIIVKPLDGYILNALQNKVDELKETYGNRDFSQGSTAGGVTAASAIAALQEAGNKLSRDMIKASYRTFASINYMCIELIRQFYTEDRWFRIQGNAGKAEFKPYSNA
ncbi:MAG: hypothetical protein WCU80_05515, partial [Paludibacteraceae bacterium]